MTFETLQAFAQPPQPRVTRNTRYEVYVYRTRTGEVVDRLPLVGTPRWESGVNLTGSWSVQVSLDSRYVSKDKLRQLIQAWYWSWAIVQGGRIFQAGPVVSTSYRDGENYVTVNGLGLWGLYKQKRVLINAARLTNGGIATSDADFAFGTGTESEHGAPIPIERRNLSLPTIMKRLLENEQDKPGGAVPLATLPDDIAGDSVREFLASQLAYTGNRMHELTQVVDGPELELWPEFIDTERDGIRHVPRIGNPRIGRLDFPHAWSYRQALVSFGEDSDGSGVTSRRWDRGAGFDRNIRAGFAENLDGVTSGTFQQSPLLESVGQLHSGSEDIAELNDYAQADLDSGRSPIVSLPVEVTMEGDAGDGKDPPSPTFDSVHNGDTGVMHVYNHPWRKDGPYFVRVLKMGSGSTSKRGTLTVEILRQP